MLFSGSIFSGAPFSAGGSTGADPRTLATIDMLASGSVSFDVDVDFAIAIVGGGAGVFAAPFIRRKRTTGDFPGRLSFAANAEVSPVMITLDGTGGMTTDMGYLQARIRARLQAGGGMEIDNGAEKNFRSVFSGAGGMTAQVYEEHKMRAVLLAGGGFICYAGKWTPLQAVFEGEGALVADTAYDLFGPVIMVTAKEPEGIAVLSTGTPDIFVTASDHAEIYVVAEGI